MVMNVICPYADFLWIFYPFSLSCHIEGDSYMAVSGGEVPGETSRPTPSHCLELDSFNLYAAGG